MGEEWIGVKSLEKAKRKLDTIFSKFMKGEPRGLVLTLLSLNGF